MNLGSLLRVIDSGGKAITVNLFDENNLLLISFGLPGYDCLDDFLLDDEVTKLIFANMTTINVYTDTSLNG